MFFFIFFKAFVTSSFSVIYLHLITCLCFVYILVFIFQFCISFACGGGAHLLLLCIGSKFCLETVNMASLCVCGGVGVWRFWALQGIHLETLVQPPAPALHSAKGFSISFPFQILSQLQVKKHIVFPNILFCLSRSLGLIQADLTGFIIIIIIIESSGRH